MSLFNETWARADRAEKALEVALKRIADLETALKSARADKLWYANGHSHWPRPEVPGKRITQNHNELNTLSDDEVKLMFARVAEQVDAGDLKSPANSVPVRSRLLAPFRLLMRSLRGGNARPSNAEVAGRG